MDSYLHDAESRPAQSEVQAMSEEEWFNATPDQMAEHISLDAPKTDYAIE